MSKKTAKDMAYNALLYDFYGALLTEHQQSVYEDVYFNDMSVTEVSKEYDISRQAVSDLLKRIDKILSGYEDKLGLVMKFRRAKEKVDDISVMLKNVKSEYDVNEIDKIIDIADSVLDEF